MDGLKASLSQCSLLKTVRGHGLMIGIELHKPCGELIEQARERGVLINVAAGNVIRLLPPFIISEQQATEVINTVTELVLALAAEKQAA